MIEEILEQCLNDIRANRATVADCLKKYPQYAKELQVLLRTFRLLQAAPNVKPSVAFKLKTRAQLAELTHPTSLRRSAFLLPRFSFASLAAIVFAILGLSGGIVYAASDSLPDSRLYPIKRGAEGVQILFASDATTQVHLHMTFAERRLSEAQALVNKPDQSKLTEQTIAEYSIQVDATLAAAASERTNSTPLAQELIARLTHQQDGLRTLDKKISASALEKALGAVERAKEKLNLVAPAKSIDAPPVSVPTLPLPVPTQIPTAPTLPASTNTLTPSVGTPALQNTPASIPSPALPTPTISLPGATLGAPTSAPEPLSEPPVVVPPVSQPPVNMPPVIPTLRLP